MTPRFIVFILFHFFNYKFQKKNYLFTKAVKSSLFPNKFNFFCWSYQKFDGLPSARRWSVGHFFVILIPSTRFLHWSLRQNVECRQVFTLKCATSCLERSVEMYKRKTVEMARNQMTKMRCPDWGDYPSIGFLGGRKLNFCVRLLRLSSREPTFSATINLFRQVLIRVDDSADVTIFNRRGRV
jgi:hypothetical protein